MTEERTASECESGKVWRDWTLEWLGAPALAVANGSLREKVYRERVGDRAAHQISTAGLIALLTLYLRMLQRRRPLPDRRTAVVVGAVWAAPAVLIEFGLGRARGVAWPDLLRDYDVREGRVWALVPLWTALGPEIVCRLAEGQAATRAAEV
jgi:hypothetical protein